MICPECKTAIPEEKLFTCQSCLANSHIECNSYTEKDIKQFQIINCDVCRKGEKKKVKCELCRKGIGILKSFDYKNKSSWGHANCLKWFPKIIPSLSNGFIEYRLDDKLSPETWISDCYLCKKSSAEFLVKCNRKECTLNAHPKCILFKKMEELHNEKYQFYTFHCDTHKKKKELSFNPLSALKTYGSGMNNTEEFNSNIMIQIDKNTSGFKSMDKDIILFSRENTQSEKEMGTSALIKSFNSSEDKISNSMKQKNKQEQIINESDTKEKDDDKIDIGILSTSIQCEYCFEKIYPHDNCNNIMKICKGCLSWYHLKCEGDFFGQTNGYHVKHIKASLCYKCYIVDKYNNNATTPQRCLVCHRNGGLMFPCNKTWIHYICLKALDVYFYTKNKIRKEYGIDPYKQHKSKELCSICEISSPYISKCSACSLAFHPYCGFKANFSIALGSKNSITFQCCNLHRMFHKNYHKIHLSMLKKGNDKLKEQNDSAYSFNSINTSATLRNKKLVKVNIKKKRAQNDKPPSIIKEIGSLDYEYLHTKLIKSGMINPYQISKCEWFNWGLTDPYFIIYDNCELNRILPIKQEDNINEGNDIDDINMRINEEGVYTDKNDFEKDINYFLFQITSNNKQYYLLYKALNINISYNNTQTNGNKSKLLLTPPECDRDLYNQTTFIDSPPTTFLSNKRGREQQFKSPNKDSENRMFSFSSSLFPIKQQIQFKRGFKLNSLSKRILTLENQIQLSHKSSLKNTSNDNSSIKDYISSEISIKTSMLNETIKQNQSLISLLKSHLETETEYKPNNRIKTEFKSLLNYQMISRWLKSGMLPKTFDEILSIKSLNSNMASKSIINKRTLIENQFKNDSECCICFTIEPEDASPIVFCDKCNVSFHQTCYGIINIPEGDYLCDLCLSNRTSFQDIKCCLCNNSKGAMKKIDNTLWGHVTCILLSDQFVFNDYREMKNIAPVIYCSTMPISKPHSTCQICKSNNGEIKQCSCCWKSYHFFCAYFEGYHLSIEDNKVIPHLANNINKKLTFQIVKCKNDGKWNNDHLQEQLVIRRLIYQKDLIKK